MQPAEMRLSYCQGSLTLREPLHVNPRVLHPHTPTYVSRVHGEIFFFFFFFYLPSSNRITHSAESAVTNAGGCFTNSNGLSDRATDHPPMLFVHSRMVRRPGGQSVAVSGTPPWVLAIIYKVSLNNLQLPYIYIS